MDLRQLRYFVTVAEELHFGRAAARLSMTQPPLSQQIAALEEELRTKLFVRNKRTVTLTPVAAQWLPEVRRVLADAARLPELAARLARGETGSITLAFVSTADYGVLPELMRRYRARHPDVQVLLQEATSDCQIGALLDGEIDAGLVIPVESALPSSLAYRPLVREPLILALPEAWIGSGRIRESRGKVRFREVVDLPLIVFPRQRAPAFYDAITQHYAAHETVPRVAQEAIQMQTIVSLVSAGMGVALVPASLQHLRRTGVAYRNLAGAAPLIETGLAWRANREFPALTQLIATAEALKASPRLTAGGRTTAAPDR